MAEETAPALTETERATALLTQKLWEDPRTRGKLAEAIETLNPGSVPGYGLSQLAARAKEETDKLTKLREDGERDKAARDLARAREGVIRAGLTEADIPAVEKYMQDNLVGRHDVAAEHLKHQRQREQIAAPRSHPMSWQVPGRGEQKEGDAFKGLNPGTRRDWAKNRAAEILNDFERGRAVGV
jgi:hypothetical protein